MILPVIMAGGSGTRLWPMSRTLYPKQFLPLAGSATMLQQTWQRLAGLDVQLPVTICNEEHRFIVAEQLRSAKGLGQVILEPVGRNTAPAIALAALVDQQKGEDNLLLVLAADHVIGNNQAFHRAVEQAVELAKDGQLVTFGIVPSEPHTGYGYIQAGSAKGSGFQVAEFVEKPDLVTAESYISKGNYFWNSGMFMFRSSVYLNELKQHRPDILQACEKAIAQTSQDMDFIRLDETAFIACPDESVDYAVMEKTNSAVVVPMDADWNDVGSWTALWELGEKDKDGNVSKGDVILNDSKNCMAIAGDRLVTMLGMENTIVVDTQDALLVASQDQVQRVKEIVAELKSEDRPEWKQHRTVYRPWGHYDSLDKGERYQVKSITVNPGAKLSVQMHHHRAEHWIVVSGTASVTIGDEQMLVTENQSTYIPIGKVHALENPGRVPLEMIEVQSGTYLGEDDIVRLEDRYGRV